MHTTPHPIVPTEHLWLLQLLLLSFLLITFAVNLEKWHIGHLLAAINFATVCSMALLWIIANVSSLFEARSVFGRATRFLCGHKPLKKESL